MVHFYRLQVAIKTYIYSSLKMEIIKDGRSDYNRSMKDLNTSAIFFSMVNTETDVPRITSRPAGVMEKPNIDPTLEPDYYVYYQFTPFDTKVVGRYKAQFLIRNQTGVLVLPLNDEIYINVTDSFIIDDLPYVSCYVVDFPCCIGSGGVNPGPPPVPPTTTTTTYPYITTTTTTPIQEQLVNPIITENGEYIDVGGDFYLMFVDPI